LKPVCVGILANLNMRYMRGIVITHVFVVVHVGDISVC
jgi:hypothetical protein